jgi:hypothetical protein
MTPWAARGEPMMPLVGGARRNVRDAGHRFDDRLLERGLRVGAVVHQVEAVGNAAGLQGRAIARSHRRAEFGFVGVGGFVQIEVGGKLAMQGRHQAHQRGTFLRGAALAERAVGVDGVKVPALDALVPPGADAWHHEQVHPAGVASGMRLQKAQRAVHATGLIAMHTAGDQHAGQIALPMAAAQGHEGEALLGVMFIAIAQLAISLHIKVAAQRVDGGEHVVRIAALAHLARTPLGTLSVAPGLAGGAYGHGGADTGLVQSERHWGR